MPSAPLEQPGEGSQVGNTSRLLNCFCLWSGQLLPTSCEGLPTPLCPVNTDFPPEASVWKVLLPLLHPSGLQWQLPLLRKTSSGLPQGPPVGAVQPCTVLQSPPVC